MHGSKLFWKLFLTCTAILFLGMLMLSVMNLRFLNRQVGDQMKHQVESLGRRLNDEIAAGWDSPDVLQSIADRARDETHIEVMAIELNGMPKTNSPEDTPTPEQFLKLPDIVAANSDNPPTVIGVGGSQFFSRRVKVDGEHVGYLRMTLPADSLAKVRHRNLVNSLSMLAITGLLSAAGIYWTAKQIVGPIGELTTGARQLLRGEQLAPMSFQRDDELGTLAETLRNMDEQVRARESQVRETAELLSTVLKGLNEGVLAVDDEGKILFANPAARSILGVPSEIVAGKPLAAITRNPVLRLAVSNAMTLPDKSKNQNEESLEMVSESSPSQAYILNASRLEGDPCPGVVVSFHDVSDMRQLEQMRQAFVSNVSHELKTPLSCIKAYAETLRGGAIDDASVNRKFLSQIEEQSDRLNDLILDMIRLARIESGQTAFDITSVSIADIVEVSFHRHKTSASEQNVSLHCDTELPDIKVRADEEGLQQIIDNLVDNAVKYSCKNGNIYVSWRAAGDDVFISVRDDGLGIKPEDEKRVFERFYRVDKARSSELGSTGLGLSIVKHMARAFGGGVALESKYGHGSTFHVRLLAAQPVTP